MARVTNSMLLRLDRRSRIWNVVQVAINQAAMDGLKKK